MGKALYITVNPDDLVFQNALKSLEYFFGEHQVNSGIRFLMKMFYSAVNRSLAEVYEVFHPEEVVFIASIYEIFNDKDFLTYWVPVEKYIFAMQVRQATEHFRDEDFIFGKDSLVKRIMQSDDLTVIFLYLEAHGIARQLRKHGIDPREVFLFAVRGVSPVRSRDPEALMKFVSEYMDILQQPFTDPDDLENILKLLGRELRENPTENYKFDALISERRLSALKGARRKRNKTQKILAEIKENTKFKKKFPKRKLLSDPRITGRDNPLR